MKYYSSKIKYDDEVNSNYLQDILLRAKVVKNYWSGWQFGDGPESWDRPILIKRVFNTAIFQELVF